MVDIMHLKKFAGEETQRVFAEILTYLNDKDPNLSEKYKSIIETSMLFPKMDERAQAQFLYGIETIMTTHGIDTAKNYAQVIESKYVTDYSLLFATNELCSYRPEGVVPFIDTIKNNLVMHMMEETGSGDLLLQFSRTFGKNEGAGRAFIKGYLKLRRVLPCEWNLNVLAEFIIDAGEAYRSSIETGDKLVEEYRQKFVNGLKRDRKIPTIGRCGLPKGLISADWAIKAGHFTEEEFQNANWGDP